LPINPSTGYSWVPYFPMEYMQLSDELLETKSDGAVGVGTHEQWVIAINTPGPAEIVFDYFPPGNGVKSERSVTFTVNAS
jgi:predicted secreted protein